jgi:type III pantothenate kinase
MLLAIDVGNTNTVIGVCEGNTVTRSFRVTSSTTWTSDDAELLIRGLLAQAGVVGRDGRVEGDSVLCSVVPSLTGPVAQCLERMFGRAPVIVSSRTAGGLEILYRDPHSVGGDRIADAVAVLRHYRAPAIVVDLGTATTFDVLDEGGRYLGGVISPGVITAAADLFRRAARLAAVELVLPPQVVGLSTEESIQSGVLYGAAGQVDGIVRRIITEVGFDPTVIATGGLAPLVAQVADSIDVVDETLTLKGLIAIHERQRASRD